MVVETSSTGAEIPEGSTVETSVAEVVVPSLFDPNPEYDKYALVDYMVEDIGAEFTATVSAKEYGSAFEIYCNLNYVE